MSADLDKSHEVALIEVGEDAPGQQPGEVGLNHMAWMMNSLDDLEELYQRLKDRAGTKPRFCGNISGQLRNGRAASV